MLSRHTKKELLRVSAQKNCIFAIRSMADNSDSLFFCFFGHFNFNYQLPFQNKTKLFLNAQINLDLFAHFKLMVLMRDDWRFEWYRFRFLSYNPKTSLSCLPSTKVILLLLLLFFLFLSIEFLIVIQNKDKKCYDSGAFKLQKKIYLYLSRLLNTLHFLFVLCLAILCTIQLKLHRGKSELSKL